jgi:hypothetical protein
MTLIKKPVDEDGHTSGPNNAANALMGGATSAVCAQASC